MAFGKRKEEPIDTTTSLLGTPTIMEEMPRGEGRMTSQGRGLKEN